MYATDIQPEMLELIKRKVARDQLSNVEVILGSEDDPRLPAGALDLVLMVDVYHELARPQAMLRALKRGLRPGGRLVLIEFRKESGDVPIREEHKMSVAEARAELEAEGYKFDNVIDVLPWQHILRFPPLTQMNQLVAWADNYPEQRILAGDTTRGPEPPKSPS